MEAHLVDQWRNIACPRKTYSVVRKSTVCFRNDKAVIIYRKVYFKYKTWKLKY